MILMITNMYSTLLMTLLSTFAWNELLSTFISFLFGGGIMTLGMWKINRNKEKVLTKQLEAVTAQEVVKIKQEEARVDDQRLSNTKEIIEVYKAALEDLRKLKSDESNDLRELVSKQTLDLESQELKIKGLITQLNEIKKINDSLTRSQRSLKLEVERLKNLGNDNCTNCAFQDGCAKLMAKLEGGQTPSPINK